MANSDLYGVRELSRKLDRLGAKTSAKGMRRAVKLAMTPAVRTARLLAPEGDKAHRTYIGRLVAPGFTKRSIRRLSKIEDGAAVAIIGVRKEAYYGVQFFEYPPKHAPYNKPWMSSAFDLTVEHQERALTAALKKIVLKEAKR